MNVIQRYIKPKGPRAFVNRSIWRKNGKNQAWMITNKINFNAIDEKCLEYNKYCTNLYGPNECSIIPIKKGKTMEDTIQYLENIVKYFLEHKRLKFDELVGDFIKDENDVWWLINVKGFIINDPNYMNSERNINFLQDYKTVRNIS